MKLHARLWIAAGLSLGCLAAGAGCGRSDRDGSNIYDSPAGRKSFEHRSTEHLVPDPAPKSPAPH